MAEEEHGLEEQTSEEIQSDRNVLRIFYIPQSHRQGGERVTAYKEVLSEGGGRVRDSGAPPHCLRWEGTMIYDPWRLMLADNCYHKARLFRGKDQNQKRKKKQEMLYRGV